MKGKVDISAKGGEKAKRRKERWLGNNKGGEVEGGMDIYPSSYRETARGGGRSHREAGDCTNNKGSREKVELFSLHSPFLL
jgi:hypothetical protein